MCRAVSPSSLIPLSSLTRMMGPFRALTSARLAAFFANRSSEGTIPTVGTCSSISASGPCFSSPIGYASAWM